MKEPQHFGRQVNQHRTSREWSEKKLAEEVSKVAAQINSEQEVVNARLVMSWQLGAKLPSEDMYTALEMVLIDQNSNINHDDKDRAKKAFRDAYEEAITPNAHDKAVTARRLFGSLIMKHRIDLDMRESDVVREVNALAAAHPGDRIEAADADFITGVQFGDIVPSKKWVVALSRALQLPAEDRQNLMTAYERDYSRKKPKEGIPSSHASQGDSEAIHPASIAQTLSPATTTDEGLGLDMQTIKTLRSTIIPLLNSMGLADGKGNVSIVKISAAIAKIPKSLSTGAVPQTALQTLLTREDITRNDLEELKQSAQNIKGAMKQLNQSKDIKKISRVQLSTLQNTTSGLLDTLLEPVRQRGAQLG